jgi:hypothetical protein
MTQNEIIDMARQVGFSVSGELILDDAGRTTITNRMEAFAKLVAAKEREACAKVCDELPPVGESKQWERATLKDCAAAIRARGEQA